MPTPRFRLAFGFAFCFLVASIRAQDESKKAPPEQWQIAGIRAAFGDARAPFTERSPEVQKGALRLAEENGWGAALDPQEVAIYLNSQDAIFRLQVIHALGQMGRNGGRFAKELAESLVVKCPDDKMSGRILFGGNGAGQTEVYWHTIEALVQQARDGAQIAGVIAPLVHHNDSDVRNAALEVLGRMGEQAKPFSREIATLLQSREPAIRSGAAAALGKMGEAGAAFIDDLVSLLKDDQRGVRTAAAVALCRLGNEKGAEAFVTGKATLYMGKGEGPGLTSVPSDLIEGNPKAVKLMADLLTAKAPGGSLQFGPYVRATALQSLAAARKTAAPFAQDLADALTDPDSSVQAAAADALGQIGNAAAPFVGDLLAILRVSQSDVRVKVAARIVKLTDAPFSEITQILAGQDISVRVELTAALIQLDQVRAAVAIEAAALLEDPKGGIRVDAANILGDIGPLCANFAPRLAALLKDDPSPVGGSEIRSAAARALSHLGKAGASHAREVARLLEESFVDNAAQDALARMAREDPSVAKEIAPYLNNQKDEVCCSAAKTLGQAGKNGAIYAPLLIEMLKVDHEYVRQEVVEALANMARAGAPIRQPIAALLTANEDGTVESALEVLDEIGYMESDAPIVAKLLQRPSRRLRSEVVGALGLLGSAGAKYAIDVAAVLNDPEMEAVEQTLIQKELAWKARHPHRIPEDPPIFDHVDPEPFSNLSNSFQDYIWMVASVLEKLDQWGNSNGDLDLQAAMLSAAPKTNNSFSNYRVHLRLWAGDNPEMQRSVMWLGRPDIEPMPREGLAPEETRTTLALFAKLWDHSADHPRLRSELGERITQVAKGVTATPNAETREVLEDLAKKLKESNSDAYSEVTRAIGAGDSPDKR